MQDGNFNDSDDDKDSQLNPDDEQSEEEENFQSENPNSIIREAIKNMKKELSANHISGKNSNLKEKISKFPIIPLDKLSCFLLKFVKKANLSLYDRRILFAAITPIHHMYLHVINSSQYKGGSRQSIRSSLHSPPYDPNSLKKCFDYFIKVFNLIQYDLQQIDETFFIQQFESIIDELPFGDEGDLGSTRSDIEDNIQSILHIFQKLHESQSNDNLSYKQILRCKVELKRLKIMVLPLFSDEDPNPLKNDFLSYYNSFYGEIKNFELFYKVNWIITQFKNNWNQPLFWFLPCLMAKIDSDLIFNSAMEYLQTFWTTCDLNIIDVNMNGKSDTNENESEKSDTDTNSTPDVDMINDPEELRMKMFDLLEYISYQNKLEPQKCNAIAQSLMRSVSQYNSYFNLSATISSTNFDIEDIKAIISVISALPYTMKDVSCDLSSFLNERVKLLKQYMHIYSSDISNRKISSSSTTTNSTRRNNRGNINSLIENSSTLSYARLTQQILCNSTFNEIFTYIHSFIAFASRAKDTPELYPLIKNELHRLIGFYSELLLKSQMMKDSKTLANEALQKAKEYEIENQESYENTKAFDEKSNQENENENDNEETVCVDLFYALKELAFSTRRVLATNFIKEEKRDLMERFYTFLKICCPYFDNLKEQQLINEGHLNMQVMKEFLSAAFPLFDTLDIFRFEPQNLEVPQILSAQNEQEQQAQRKEEEDKNDDEKPHFDSDDIINEIDLKSVWSSENKEILFNKSFPSIRETARIMQIGVSDDWRSVLEFKAIYKTFCRLFIVTKPQLPINEEPNEFERDIHKFFSYATTFVMDKQFNIRKLMISLSSIINSCRSLSIKWMFSQKFLKTAHEDDNGNSNNNSNDNENDDDYFSTDVTQEDKQHWDLSSLLFGIAFLSVPHPIQTISIFLMIMSSREKVTEVEGRQLNIFSDLFYKFIDNFNNETAELFVKSTNVQNCLSLFENDLDFFYNTNESSKVAGNGDDEFRNALLLQSVQKQNIREIICEINEMKEKYLKLSSMMTMMNSKYFNNPESYSRLFVEIAFFANILKSFKDTLEILKKFNLLSAPSTDHDLATSYMSLFNSTWPFVPGFLDLDMYKKDLPGFLSSLHSSILRLSSLKPNFKSIHRTFDFYMNLALCSYSFCFSSLNQIPLSIQQKEQEMDEFMFTDLADFSWNRSNYYDELNPAQQQQQQAQTKICQNDDDDDAEFNDIFNFRPFEIEEKMTDSSNSDVPKTQVQCIDEIRSHFHALAVLYSQCPEHPTILVCCEVISRVTALIKLLVAAKLSDFSFLATIMTGLSEACFAIINALNIKKEVERIVNSTIYFASLFDITLTKPQKSQPSAQPSPSRSEIKKDANQSQTLNLTPPQSPVHSQPVSISTSSAVNSSTASASSSQPKRRRVHHVISEITASNNNNSNSSNDSGSGRNSGIGAVSHIHHSKAKSLHRSERRSARPISSVSQGMKGRQGKKRSCAVSDADGEASCIKSLSDFASLSASIENAAPIFERMDELIPKESADVQHFYIARCLFDSIRHSVGHIKVPTSSEQFVELVRESNMKMELLRQHSKTHLKRLHSKIDSLDQKHKKDQSNLEADYACINQKIKTEIVKGEQLDEDIANIKAELRRNSEKNSDQDKSFLSDDLSTPPPQSHHQYSPLGRPSKQKKARSMKTSLNSSSSSSLQLGDSTQKPSTFDVLNFNFNFNSSSSSSSSTSSSLKNKPIAKAQLIMAQAQDLQKQNDFINTQLQKNELELTILNSLRKSRNSDVAEFVQCENEISEAVQNIMKNASDVFLPNQQQKPHFDVDEDDKPSSVLSKSSIFKIMNDIVKWDDGQQQNMTTIDHNELCDKVEMLAYGLINGTKSKEGEMVKLQSQLKNMKNSQKEKLLKLKSLLREIDLDEE